MDTIRYDLRTLNRQFQLASKQRTVCSNNLIALLEQSFPSIRKCFDSPVRNDGTQNWVDFAHTFWHVDCVRKQSLNAFSERYRKWCTSAGDSTHNQLHEIACVNFSTINATVAKPNRTTPPLAVNFIPQSPLRDNWDTHCRLPPARSLHMYRK